MDTLEQTGEGNAGGPPRSPRRRLDGRAITICVCIALIAALAAALLASVFLEGDDKVEDAGSDRTMQLVDQIDSRELLTTELLTVDGKQTTLEALRSTRPLVVNLWGAYCTPCIEEMPLLEQASLDNPEVDVLGVDVLDQLDKAKVMAERTGISYPWVQDPKGDFAYAAQSAGLPTTFILLPSGEVAASKTGAFESQDELQRWLDDNLA